MSAQIIDVTRGVSTRQELQPEYRFHIGSTDGSIGAAVSAELSRLEELKGVELRSDNPDPDVLTVVVHDPDAMIGSYLENVRQHGGQGDAVVTSVTAHVIGYFIEDVTHGRTTAEVWRGQPVDPSTAAAWADQLLALATRDPLLLHGPMSDLSSYEVAKASWQVIAPGHYVRPTPEGLRDLFGSAWRTTRTWEVSDPARAAEVEHRMVNLLGKDAADSGSYLHFDPQHGVVTAVSPTGGWAELGRIQIGPPPAVRSEAGVTSSLIQLDDLFGIPALVRGSAKLLLSAGEHVAAKFGTEIAAGHVAADLADGVVAHAASKAGEAAVTRDVAEGVERTGSASLAKLTPEATALTPEATALRDEVVSLLRAAGTKDAEDVAAKVLGGFKVDEIALLTLTDDVYTLRLGVGNTPGGFGTGSYKTLEEAVQARDQLLVELRSEGLAGFKSRVAVPEGYWDAFVDALTGKYGFSTTTHLQIQRVPAGSVIAEGTAGPQRVLQATVFADTSTATGREALHQLGEAATTLQGGAHQVAIVKGNATIVSGEVTSSGVLVNPVKLVDPPGSNTLNATVAGGEIEPHPGSGSGTADGPTPDSSDVSRPGAGPEQTSQPAMTDPSAPATTQAQPVIDTSDGIPDRSPAPQPPDGSTAEPARDLVGEPGRPSQSSSGLPEHGPAAPDSVTSRPPSATHFDKADVEQHVGRLDNPEQLERPGSEGNNPVSQESIQPSEVDGPGIDVNVSNQDSDRPPTDGFDPIDFLEKASNAITTLDRVTSVIGALTEVGKEMQRVGHLRDMLALPQFVHDFAPLAPLPSIIPSSAVGRIQELEREAARITELAKSTGDARHGLLTFLSESKGLGAIMKGLDVLSLAIDLVEAYKDPSVENRADVLFDLVGVSPMVAPEVAPIAAPLAGGYSLGKGLIWAVKELTGTDITDIGSWLAERHINDMEAALEAANDKEVRIFGWHGTDSWLNRMRAQAIREEAQAGHIVASSPAPVPGTGGDPADSDGDGVPDSSPAPVPGTGGDPADSDGDGVPDSSPAPVPGTGGDPADSDGDGVPDSSPAPVPGTGGDPADSDGDGVPDSSPAPVPGTGGDPADSDGDGVPDSSPAPVPGTGGDPADSDGDGVPDSSPAPVPGTGGDPDPGAPAGAFDPAHAAAPAGDPAMGNAPHAGAFDPAHSMVAPTGDPAMGNAPHAGVFDPAHSMVAPTGDPAMGNAPHAGAFDPAHSMVAPTGDPAMGNAPHAGAFDPAHGQSQVAAQQQHQQSHQQAQHFHDLAQQVYDHGEHDG